MQLLPTEELPTSDESIFADVNVMPHLKLETSDDRRRVINNVMFSTLSSSLSSTSSSQANIIVLPSNETIITSFSSSNFDKMNATSSITATVPSSAATRRNNKRPLLSLAGCCYLGLITLHQVAVTPVEGFTPAISSPLFVKSASLHNTARSKVAASKASSSSKKNSSKKGSSSTTSVSASANSIGLPNAVDEPPYVPSSLYAADSNDQRYSASDWYHNMKTLPRSSILKEIKGPVTTIALWSGLVSVIHKLFAMNGMAGAASAMCMSSKPHSFLVSALGLLLVFRTNSAYQRFAVRACCSATCLLFFCSF